MSAQHSLRDYLHGKVYQFFPHMTRWKLLDKNHTRDYTDSRELWFDDVEAYVGWRMGWDEITPFDRVINEVCAALGEHTKGGVHG
jgi:hypothetical protein